MYKILNTALVILSVSFLYHRCATNTAETKYFGEKITSQDSVVHYAKLLSDLTQKTQDDSLTNIKIIGKVGEVCQMSGCWLTLLPEGNEKTPNDSLFVSMRDHRFKVSKNILGKRVVAKGDLHVAYLPPTDSVKTALHDITFYADGILILDDNEPTN